MNRHHYCVYITTNDAKTTLYIGVTNNLTQRLTEHYLSKGKPDTFAGKYCCYNLLYFEEFQYVNDAIAREKQLKGWLRKKKLELIKSDNPKLEFLNKTYCDFWPPNEENSLRDS